MLVRLPYSIDFRNLSPHLSFYRASQDRFSYGGCVLSDVGDFSIFSKSGIKVSDFGVDPSAMQS